jgi:hypothetical protein
MLNCRLHSRDLSAIAGMSPCTLPTLVLRARMILLWFDSVWVDVEKRLTDGDSLIEVV